MINTNVGYPTKCAIGAQRIARKGKPIFPCREDKSPLTPRGFKDATTEPGRVTGFWTKYPDALIGMPTGSRSGVFVLDVDRLSALAELPQGLPRTLTVRTRSGGLHMLFRHVPGVTNSAGSLPEDIDVRGEGGYVIVPPSPGYSWVDRSEIADVPGWLLELMSERRSAVRVKVTPGAGDSPKVDLDGIEPIPQGGRNNGLSSIAGRLHDGRDLADLEDALLRVNEEKCSPPLPASEVIAIARSVYRYEPCTPGKGAADVEATRYLDELERELWASAWPKIGGKSERSLVVVALKAARKFGRKVDGGVEVDIAHSQLALGAATSKRTVMRVLGRSEWIQRGKSAREGQSGSVVLKPPRAVPVTEGRARCHHSTQLVSTGRGGDSLRAPFTSPRLRWSAPGILRLGKSSEAVVDYLERVGGSATIEELADFMHVSRLRDFKRRVIGRLVERGIITCEGEGVSLVEDWLDAINAERERGGEIKKLRLDTLKFNLQSKAYRERFVNKPDEHDDYGHGEGWGDRGRGQDPGQRDLSPLARAVYDYLLQNPRDSYQLPGWLGSTLWAIDAVEGKPTAADIKAALDELGGEGFRTDLISLIREQDKRAHVRDLARERRAG